MVRRLKDGLEEAPIGNTLSRLEKKTVIQGIADGYLNTDLNTRFISNTAATYLPLAPDDGIEGIAIGDTLIVDRSIKLKPGRVILAEIEGQYCLRRIVKQRDAFLLVDDKGYTPPRLLIENEAYHGTVTHNIHVVSW